MPARGVLRRIARSAPVRGVLGTGIARSALLSRAICVFLYHEVSDAPSEFHSRYGLNVTPAVFERHIAAISGHFNVISASDLVSGNYSTPAALVTFDDGSAGCFENALPILREYRCPSLIFLNMAPVRGEMFWSGLITYLCLYRADFVAWLGRHAGDVNPAAPFLRATPALVQRFLADEDQGELLRKAREFYGPFASPEQLASAARGGDVAFGNHLYNHYNCVTLDRDALASAYLLNEEALSAYPNRVPLFSYPFGQPHSCYNEDTHGTLRSLGAKLLFSALPRVNYGAPALLHRIAPGGDLGSGHDLLAWTAAVAARQLFSRPDAGSVALP